MNKKDISYLYEKKARGEKMPRTALYDYPMACIAEEAGIDIINMGDSIAMVMLGYETTISTGIGRSSHWSVTGKAADWVEALQGF